MPSSPRLGPPAWARSYFYGVDSNLGISILPARRQTITGTLYQSIGGGTQGGSCLIASAVPTLLKDNRAGLFVFEVPLG